MIRTLHRPALLLLSALALGACDQNPTEPVTGFLAGTANERQIGLVLNTTEKALTLFQVGDPTQQRKVALGSSDAVTPVGFAVRGTRAAVPLGNAASVAIVDLQKPALGRVFLLRGGNATGATWVDDQTVLVANLIDDYVGRFTLSQSGDTIRDTVKVAPAPTAIVVRGERAYVVSGNLDEKYAPLGNGVVTVLDTRTLNVLGTVDTGDTNPSDAAFGPDGLLYVVNTTDFSRGSLTIIDPSTLKVVTRVTGMGAGPGRIRFDAQGRALVSGFFFGTLVWDSRTRQFVRGPGNPVCARLADGSCRGAADSAPDEQGNVYQAFFGSPSKKLSPWIFRYRAGSYELMDSISVGPGPYSLQLQKF